MTRGLLIAAGVFGLMGVTWLGQGIGLLGGSVMSGRSEWAWVGTTLLVASLGLVLLAKWFSRRN